MLREVNWNEEIHSLLEERVAALEELVAYCSLPRLLRLRRRLRVSVQPYKWAADDFNGQRVQAMSEEQMARFRK